MLLCSSYFVNATLIFSLLHKEFFSYIWQCRLYIALMIVIVMLIVDMLQNYLIAYDVLHVKVAKEQHLTLHPYPCPLYKSTWIDSFLALIAYSLSPSNHIALTFY